MGLVSSCTNKGLLTEVACIIPIARITQDKVVDGAFPAFDKGVEGGNLPFLELRYQFRIIHIRIQIYRL